MLNISRLHYPVTALGPGRRIGVWVQGCTLACAGCVSRDTWNPFGGTELDVDAILHWIAGQCATDTVDGVTISGGEPSEQPAALRELALGIERLRSDGAFDGDILCYTGVEAPTFHMRCPWAAAVIDAIITGPFDVTAPTALWWRGSANQQLLPLTPRGEHTYARYLTTEEDKPHMQFTVADGQVWMVGIPRRGDLPRLEAALRERGVTLGGVSWRP